MEEGSKNVLKATVLSAGSEMEAVTASRKDGGPSASSSDNVLLHGKETAENTTNCSRDRSSTTIKVDESTKNAVKGSSKDAATPQASEGEHVIGGTSADPNSPNSEKSLQLKTIVIAHVKEDSSGSSKKEHTQDSAKPQDMEAEQCPNASGGGLTSANCDEEKNTVVEVSAENHPSATSNSEKSLDVEENPDKEVEANSSSKKDQTNFAAITQAVSDSSSEKCDKQKKTTVEVSAADSQKSAVAKEAKNEVDPIIQESIEADQKIKVKEENKSDTQVDEEEEEEEEDYDYYDHDPREIVLELLEEVEAPGSFAVGGTCPATMTMPGLVIDGVGPIGLPLSETLAQAIASRCVQAPFGRGAETLVDRTVRNTKQLAPDSFQIQNPKWEEFMKNLVATVSSNLGVQEHLTVEAQLYKLLLYEKGSFFKMHRDSEKVDFMFGTLVIALPSQFEGGELLVKHQKDEKIFAQATDSAFTSQYAAFYADCQHELKEVTNGYRLCLVYNLVKLGAGSRPCAVNQSHVLSCLRSAARAWGRDFDGNKLVIMTQHLYTQLGKASGNGSSSAYKGNDAALVTLLELAVEEGIDIEWEEGTVSFSESGWAAGDEDDYYGDSSFTWAETTESNLDLILSSSGEIPITKEELVPEGFFEDKECDNETFEPTGNEGVNAERQYSDEDAIVVWPRSQRWVVLAGNNLERMLDFLLNACEQNSEPKTELKLKCQKVLDKLVFEATYRSYGINESVKNVLKCLSVLDDSDLATAFIKNFGRNPLALGVSTELPAFIEKFGAQLQPALLESISANSFKKGPNQLVAFVVECWKSLSPTTSTSQIANQMVQRLVRSMRPVSLEKLLPMKEILSTESVRRFVRLLVSEQFFLPKAAALARKFIERVVWVSCQQRASSSYSRSSSVTADGPKSLLKAEVATLCEKYGWKTFKAVLTDAVRKLHEKANPGCALSFVNELAFPFDSQSTEKHEVCTKLVEIVANHSLKDEKNFSDNTASIELFSLIDRSCPSLMESFVSAAVKCENAHLARSLNKTCGSASPAGQSAVLKITHQIAEKKAAKLSTPSTVALQVWTLPVPVLRTLPVPILQQQAAVASFLQSPCERVLDFPLAKKEHAMLAAQLQSLTSSGVLEVTSHQPRGRGSWHVELVKLKSQLVSAASVQQCDCSSRYGGYGHSYHSSSSSQSEGSCVLKPYTEQIAQYKSDKKALDELLQCLPQDLQVDLTRKSKQAPAAVAAAANPSESSVASGALKKTKPSEVIDLT